jgi:hypothetical protein
MWGGGGPYGKKKFTALNKYKKISHSGSPNLIE